jgi:aminoglycoside 6-adenylyltransferase
MNMDMVKLGYEKLAQSFVAWALDQDNIRAAIVIGSRARRDHPADEFSDLDIMLIVRDMQPYLQRLTG